MIFSCVAVTFCLYSLGKVTLSLKNCTNNVILTFTPTPSGVGGIYRNFNEASFTWDRSHNDYSPKDEMTGSRFSKYTKHFVEESDKFCRSLAQSSPDLEGNVYRIFEDLHNRTSGIALEVEDASICLGERILLDKVSFMARAGECIGIVGNNGVGKSSLFDTIYQEISGVYSGIPNMYTSMKVRFDGRDVERTRHLGDRLYDLISWILKRSDLPKCVSDLDFSAIMESKDYIEYSDSRKESIGHNIAYMRQDYTTDLDKEATVSECISGVYRRCELRDSVIDYIERNIAILNELASSDSCKNSVISKELLLLYNNESESVRKKLKNVRIAAQRLVRLFGMEDTLEIRVGFLSGGYKMRLYLLLILLQFPSLILLDEPTNNLDFATVSFLKTTLKKLIESNGFSVLLVSHDTALLNSLCDSVFQMRGNGKMLPFSGDFDSFILQGSSERSRRVSRIEKLQTTLRRLKDQYNEVLNSTKGSLKARKVILAQKEQLIEECENELRLLKESECSGYSEVYERNLFNSTETEQGSSVNVKRLIHSPILQYGDAATFIGTVFSIRRLSLEGDDGNRIFSGLNLSIQSGERMVLLGNNGAGKTTLINLLRSSLSQKDSEDSEYLGNVLNYMNIVGGSISSAPGLIVNYYAQNCSTILECPETVEWLSLEYSQLEANRQNREHICSYLKNFHLHESLSTNVCELSFGEKSRLLLALLFLRRSNFLFLDEPSNHLDAYMQKVLSKMLNEVYTGGGFVLATHDLNLLESLRNISSVVYLYSHDRVFIFDGTFKDHYIKFRRENLSANSREVLEFLKESKETDQFEREASFSDAEKFQIKTPEQLRRELKRRKKFGHGTPSSKPKIKNAKRWS